MVPLITAPARTTRHAAPRERRSAKRIVEQHWAKHGAVDVTASAQRKPGSGITHVRARWAQRAMALSGGKRKLATEPRPRVLLCRRAFGGTYPPHVGDGPIWGRLEPTPTGAGFATGGGGTLDEKLRLTRLREEDKRIEGFVCLSRRGPNSSRSPQYPVTMGPLVG